MWILKSAKWDLKWASSPSTSVTAFVLLGCENRISPSRPLLCSSGFVLSLSLPTLTMCLPSQTYLNATPSHSHHSRRGVFLFLVTIKTLLRLFVILCFADCSASKESLRLSEWPLGHCWTNCVGQQPSMNFFVSSRIFHSLLLQLMSILKRHLASPEELHLSSPAAGELHDCKLNLSLVGGSG